MKISKFTTLFALPALLVFGGCSQNSEQSRQQSAQSQTVKQEEKAKTESSQENSLEEASDQKQKENEKASSGEETKSDLNESNGQGIQDSALGVPVPNPDAVKETVSFTVDVIHKDGSKKSFPVSSDAVSLAQALLDEKLISGDESAYGLFVSTVDGEKAESGWWKLLVNGKDAMSGASGITPEEGASYTWQYVRN